MSTDSQPQRRWGSLKHLATHRGVSERTARLWAEQGYLDLYRIQGVRGVVVDINEADAALDALAKQGKVKPGYGTFGGQTIRRVAKVVDQ